MTQARTRPAPLSATVVRTQRLTGTLVRIVFGGPELAGFRGSIFTDAYVKLSFPPPGVSYPRPFDPEWIRANLPVEQWPTVRTYTVRSWNAHSHELAIDFVVHGDTGVAGPWAAAARPGDHIFLSGPGGAFAPDPDLDWHLFAGDESALPAIAAAVDSLPRGASGHVLLEVASTDAELPITGPAGVTVRYVHTSGRPFGHALVEAVRTLDFPVGTFDAFVHGEAGFVKDLRTHLRVDRAVPRERLSISGYWRIGNSEEGWRAGKAEWNRQAEEAEQLAGSVSVAG